MRTTSPIPLRSLLLAAVTLASFSGCVGRPKLTDKEKAHLIVEKRKEAQDVLAKYRSTGYKELDLLEKYAALHRENTEIAPSLCPRCWAEFGEALSFIGYHYWFLHQDTLDALEKDPQDKEEKARAREYKEKWVDSFTRSNEAYESHFRDVQLVHPYSYERVMRHYELLGNFERALYYLQKCLDSYPNTVDNGLDDQTRQRFEKLRRIYRQAAVRQKEREEVKGERPAPPTRPLSGRPPKPGTLHKRAGAAEDDSEE